MKLLAKIRYKWVFPETKGKLLIFQKYFLMFGKQTCITSHLYLAGSGLIFFHPKLYSLKDHFSRMQNFSNNISKIEALH